ncbi:MAG TPA: hypothetical protein VGG34_07705 [Opitutaceae bacterium]|jgi:hypothetical protein
MRRLIFLLLAGLLVGGAWSRAADTPLDPKEGIIVGTPIQRPNGHWLGLELKENHFLLHFYNAKKKPEDADASSAVLKWAVHYQPNDERTELAPTDDPSTLGSGYTIRAPHSFKLHIALFTPTSGDNPESYVIDFSA